MNSQPVNKEAADARTTRVRRRRRAARVRRVARRFDKVLIAIVAVALVGFVMWALQSPWTSPWFWIGVVSLIALNILPGILFEWETDQVRQLDRYGEWREIHDFHRACIKDIREIEKKNATDTAPSGETTPTA